MRIAYFADAPRVGGAERAMFDVAEAVVAAGHEVVAISPQQEVLDAFPDGVAAVRAGSDAYASAGGIAERVRLLAKEAPAVRRALAGFEVVHINNGGYPGSDLCRLAGMVARGSRVMSVHSMPWEREDSVPRAQAVVDRALWRSLDAVIGATRVVGDRLAELRGMPAELYRWIPYGVREPGGRADAAALREALAGPDELVAVMVSGTDDPGKGHAVLAAAVPDGVRAVFVGAAPEGLGGERVTVAGRVDDVGAYLRAADVVVVPSTRFESLPLVVLEAMGAGKPVFGSRLAGIPEAIDDGVTGRLFEPGDVQALAGLLAAPGDLAAMGAAGRERWAERFSVEAMAAAVLAVYREL